MRRILAILLSTQNAGAGHVVMGHTRKGGIWFAISMLLYGAFVASLVFGAIYLTWLSLALLVCLRIAAIVDTMRISVPTVAPRNLTIALIVVGIIGISVISGLIGTYFAQAYQMPTPSMSPSLEVGDRFLSSSVIGKLERGQVIVFRYPPNPASASVQRIIALPGDTVEIRSGSLTLNGKPVERTLLDDSCGSQEMECTIWQETIDGNTYKTVIGDEASPFVLASREFGPVTVPDGHLFVLGDNRDNSADSRYWGYVPIDFVLAKPRMIYWPSSDSNTWWNRIGRVPE